MPDPLIDRLERDRTTALEDARRLAELGEDRQLDLHELQHFYARLADAEAAHRSLQLVRLENAAQ